MTVKQKSQFGDKLCNYGITTSFQFLSYFVSKRVIITTVTGVFQIEFCLFEIFSSFLGKINKDASFVEISVELLGNFIFQTNIGKQ